MSQSLEKLYEKAMTMAQRKDKAKDEEVAGEQPFWAFKMDETKYWDLDKLAKEIGKTPTKIWSIYLTDMARTHIASLTASVGAEHVYSVAKYKGKITETQWEKTDEALREALYQSESFTYFNWSDIDSVIKKPGRAKMIGEFENFDDAREYMNGNPPY